MGTLDVITYGGGANYRDVFIGVALMTGTGAMGSLIRVGLLIGLIWGILRMMGDLNPGRVLKWVITAAIMYGCLFVPKVDVQIVDKFNPVLPGALVGNVPLGVGFAESLASQIGSRMIDMTETAFADPAELEYSKTGMIFGAKFMEAATRARFTDQTYETNLEAFFRNCVFYDITDNQYTPDDLAKTNDMWAFLQAHTPNPARMTPYIAGAGPGNTSNLTCTDAFNNLKGLAPTKGDETVAAIVKRLEPMTPDASLVGNGYGTMGALLGLTNMASTSAQASIVQMATLNSLNSTIATTPGVGGGSNPLAQAQADLQTQNAGALLAHVGENSIVVLKIVIDLLFVGMFPILFPLFLLPSVGVKMLQGYVTGFFYLQLWGPMYVIVHRIIMSAAETQMAAAAAIPGNPDGPGFNMLTLSGINDVNANIQTVAGMMVLMIPVIAGALTKGAMAVGSQGEALLQPFRSGAESAAAAQTTGNWSYGNTNVDTHAFHTMSGNRLETSGHYDAGLLRIRTANDDEITLDRSGHQVAGRTAAHDSAATFDRVKERADSLSLRAQQASEVSRGLDTVASKARSTVEQQVSEAMTSRSHGTENRTSVSNNDADSSTGQLSWLSSISDQVARKHGVDAGWAERVAKSETMSLVDQWGLSGSLEGGRRRGSDNGSYASGGMGVSHQSQASGSESQEASRARTKNEQQALEEIRNRINTADHRKSLERVTTAAINRAQADVDSTMHSTSNKNSKSFSTTSSFSEARRQARQDSVGLQRSSERMSKLAQTIREDRGSHFYQWATAQLETDAYGIKRDPKSGEIQSVLAGRTPADLRILEDLEDRYAAKFMPDADMPSQISDTQAAIGDLPAPGALVDPSRPQPSSAHPHGHGAAHPRHAAHATAERESSAIERARAAGMQLPSTDRDLRAEGALAETEHDLAGEVTEGLSRRLPANPVK